MIRKGLLVLALALAMIWGTSISAKAEAGKSASAEVSVMSNYVWRGQKLSEDWVVQPSITFGYGGFGANLWANWDSDANQGGGDGELTETDYTLSYGFSPYEKVGLELGYIYYALSGVPDTQEFYLGASFDVLLQPSLTLYYDIEEGNGGFLVASIGHSFALPNKISLDLGASASVDLDNKVMGAGEDGAEFSDFYNGEVSAALTIPVREDFTISPMLAYSFPLSNDAEAAIRNASFDADEDIFYGGVTASLSF